MTKRKTKPTKRKTKPKRKAKPKTQWVVVDTMTGTILDLKTSVAVELTKEVLKDKAWQNLEDYGDVDAATVVADKYGYNFCDDCVFYTADLDLKV
jgi:hypothetical protein